MLDLKKLFLDYPYKEYQNKIQKIKKDKLASFFLSRFNSKEIKVEEDFGIISATHMKAFSSIMGFDVYLIGDLLVENIDESSYIDLIEKIKKYIGSNQKTKIVVIKEPIDNTVVINSLIKEDFYYVCGESVFTLDMDNIEINDKQGFDKVRLARVGDMNKIKELSHYAHEDIRYYYDPFFNRDKVGLFYEEIAASSIEKNNEICFVYEVEGIVEGFITILFNKGLSREMEINYCSLDYISVNPEQQKKGIGFVLNNYAIDYLKNNGYKINVVKTMSSNYRAMKLLMKNGFILTGQNLVYHCCF